MVIINGKYCVYAHINKTNGKMYVGQTCQRPERRWRNGKTYRCNPYFYKSIIKYGWNGFDHIIIASHLTKSEADNFEKLLIAHLDLTNPNMGYNMTKGGEGATGRFPSEETRKKLKEAKQGSKNTFYGKHHTDETRRQMSEIAKQRRGEKSPMYGRFGDLNPNSRAVYQIDKNNNTIIARFGSAGDAARQLGLCASTITKCLKGKYGHKTHGGFKWSYADNKEEDEI